MKNKFELRKKTCSSRLTINPRSFQIYRTFHNKSLFHQLLVAGYKPVKRTFYFFTE